jgi:transposase
VGGALRPTVECGDDVAGEPPAGLDAEKKSLAASERDEEARHAWREAAAQLDPQQVVFVDESSTNSSLTRRDGWAPHDQRATGSVPRTHGKNTPVVAALAPDGLHVPWRIEGAMETTTFAWFITAQLAPTLRPGQVVVLDNLRVHKAESMRPALDACQCQVLFLPPSSPDFTPIEQAFSKIKARLRGPDRNPRPCLEAQLALLLHALTCWTETHLPSCTL